MSDSAKKNVCRPEEVREIMFPVPWGTIAAKAWRDPCLKPIILLHGIQDNAGTFDQLIPFLPEGFYYLAIDLPGHGHSTRFPNGFYIDFLQYVFSVNRVVKLLQWEQFTIIGHSLGGQIAKYYAAMFPEQVQKIVVLDTAYPILIEMQNYLSSLRQMHEGVMDMERRISKTEPPSYTYEKALEKTIVNRWSPITREAAERLLTRNLKRGENEYHFSMDQRLKLTVPLPLTLKQHNYNMRRIQCPALFILTEKIKKMLNDDDPLKKNPALKIVTVKGEHDVHNISPEVVAPYIVNFLLKHKSSL